MHQRHPFGHAAESVPGLWGCAGSAVRGGMVCGRAAAVVADLDLDRSRQIVDPDLSGRRRPGMLQHVGDRLLYDPIDGESDGRRDGRSRAPDEELEAITGASHQFGEISQAGEGR